jgi:hypothetical protein
LSKCLKYDSWDLGVPDIDTNTIITWMVDGLFNGVMSTTAVVGF